MPTIDGLTAEQCKVLDELWACDTLEDMQELLDSKSGDELREVITLREMIVLSLIDEDIEKMESYPDAETILRNIMK